MQIKDKDIATIEVLHDFILHHTHVKSNNVMLKKSRELTSRMYLHLNNKYNRDKIETPKIFEFTLSNKDSVSIYEAIGYDCIKICSIEGNQKRLEYLFQNLTKVNGVKRDLEYYYSLSFDDMNSIMECLTRLITKVEL